MRLPDDLQGTPQGTPIYNNNNNNIIGVINRRSDDPQGTPQNRRGFFGTDTTVSDRYHGGGMNANARKRPFPALARGVLEFVPRARQRAFKVPCRPITAHSRKGGGLFGDRPSEAELKQKTASSVVASEQGLFPCAKTTPKTHQKAFGALCLARSFSEGFPLKRRAGGNTLLPPSAPLLPHINVYMKPIEK